MAKTTIKKTPYDVGRQMVKQGLMTEESFRTGIENGLIAGVREKESYRLKGVREKITVNFPTPSVTLPKKMTLNDLDSEDRTIVERYKSALADAIRETYHSLRDEYAEKVTVTY